MVRPATPEPRWPIPPRSRATRAAPDRAVPQPTRRRAARVCCPPPPRAQLPPPCDLALCCSQVTGDLAVDGSANPIKFAQTFHLMPNGASWYVHNDIFRLNYC